MAFVGAVEGLNFIVQMKHCWRLKWRELMDRVWIHLMLVIWWKFIVPVIWIMILAIKLIIIHITLIYVQFRYVDIDAQEPAQTIEGKRKVNKRAAIRKVIRILIIISPWPRANIKGNKRCLLGMLDGSDGDAVRQDPFPLCARIIRISPPATEWEVGRCRGKLGRSKRWGWCGIFEPGIKFRIETFVRN